MIATTKEIALESSKDSKRFGTCPICGEELRVNLTDPNVRECAQFWALRRRPTRPACSFQIATR